MNVEELRRGLDDLPPDAEVWLAIDEVEDVRAIGPLVQVEAERGDDDEGRRLFVYLTGPDAELVGQVERIETG